MPSGTSPGIRSLTGVERVALPKKAKKAQTATAGKRSKRAQAASTAASTRKKSNRKKPTSASGRSSKASEIDAKPKARVSAETLATRQKDISVSEFFAKNRHLLGFDSPARALLTTVKEAVDNSLDACEEANILPEVIVEILQIAEDRFQVIVQDNGPGIVKGQLSRIFGRLLYGSKFHSLKQSRGQQGIGISAAGMYGYLTTGKPIEIISRVGARRPAFHVQLTIDTAKNTPVILKEDTVKVDWKHGTRVQIELEATYKKGRHSVDSFLEQVAIANPHLKLIYKPPGCDEPIVFERVTKTLPEAPREILPHPHGVELGVLMKMLEDTKARNVKSFLSSEFSRVTPRVADAILAAAAEVGKEIRPTARPRTVGRKDAERLHKAIARTKIMAPPTNCLSPIGAELIEKALTRNLKPEFVCTVTRPPAVYRGNPFLIEAGLAYGGGEASEELAMVYRYANRVPLQYQQSACAMNKAVISVPWRNYEIQQSRGALPSGPITVFIHIASAWVPFTSESKKAVAHYDEILKELRLALMDVGRKIGIHLRKRRRQLDAARKHAYIEKYIPQIVIALQEILKLTDKQRNTTQKKLTVILEKSRKL